MIMEHYCGMNFYYLNMEYGVLTLAWSNRPYKNPLGGGKICFLLIEYDNAGGDRLCGFSEAMGRKLGDGSKISFWDDIWIV